MFPCGGRGVLAFYDLEESREGREEVDESSIFMPNVTTQTDSRAFTRSGEIKKVTFMFRSSRKIWILF